MKVLYIGHYRESSGWATATQNLIKALHSVDVDVVCRNIRLTNNTNIDPLFDQLENKDTNNVDYCIQHVLPHHITGTSKFKKNVSCSLLDSCNVQDNQWLPYLRNVNEVWVPCRDNYTELCRCGIPTKVVPYACDIKKYERDSNTDLGFDKQNVHSAYKFYTIADMGYRKNIQSIVKSYYSTFRPDDNVLLILKINQTAINRDMIFSHIHHMCSEIRKEMNIYKDENDYNNIMVIPDYFSEEEIHALHKECDCYVNMSHGESWCIPSFDAMCYGNHPISVGWGGPRDYIDASNKNTGTLVDYSLVTCVNTGAAFKHLYTGREFWATGNEMQASIAMRYYYENRKDQKTQDGLNCGKNFTFEKVGSIMKDYLLS